MNIRRIKAFHPVSAVVSALLKLQWLRYSFLCWCTHDICERCSLKFRRTFDKTFSSTSSISKILVPRNPNIKVHHSRSSYNVRAMAFLYFGFLNRSILCWETHEPLLMHFSFSHIPSQLDTCFKCATHILPLNVWQSCWWILVALETTPFFVISMSL